MRRLLLILVGIVLSTAGMFCAVGTMLATQQPTTSTAKLGTPAVRTSTPEAEVWAMDAEPTATPRPTLVQPPTLVPSPTVDRGPNLLDIMQQYDDATEIQRKKLLAEVRGKRVYWEGEIINVYSDSEISVSIGSLGFFSMATAHLQDIPPEQAMKYQKDQYIRFWGTISYIESFLGLTAHLTNVEIVSRSPGI